MEPIRPKKIQAKQRPEAKIQTAITVFLEARGWIVKPTHGGMFQAGFPDLYITHEFHGPRWVEVKLPGFEGSKWTKAQLHWFPIWSSNGTPIWVLTGDTEHEYKKLFQPENWMEFMLLKL